MNPRWFRCIDVNPDSVTGGVQVSFGADSVAQSEPLTLRSCFSVEGGIFVSIIFPRGSPR